MEKELIANIIYNMAGQSEVGADIIAQEIIDALERSNKTLENRICPNSDRRSPCIGERCQTWDRVSRECVSVALLDALRKMSVALTLK